MIPNRKSYQLSKPEIEFHMMEEMYAALCMCTCEEKTTFLGKFDLTIVEWGEKDYGTLSHDTKPYSYFAAHSALRHFSQNKEPFIWKVFVLYRALSGEFVISRTYVCTHLRKVVLSRSNYCLQC